MKDQVLAADRIYNNTIFRSPIVLGFGGWRGGSQELFYNNVVRLTNELSGKISQGDWHQLIQNYGQTVWDNTFQMTPVVGVTKKTTIDNLTIKDAGLTGVYGATSNCAGGCNMGAAYPYVQQIQPQFVWNNWGVKQFLSDTIDGSTLIFNGNPVTSIATISGYAGKRYPISTTNGYSPWGLVNKMAVAPRAMDSVACAPRRNLYSFYLPTALDTTGTNKSDTSFAKAATPTDVMKLAPLWDSVGNKNTILRQAWNQDNLGNPDGTVGNRGAFCYDSMAAKTVMGCIPSGAVLSLVDQQIISLQGTSVKIPLIVSQVNGQTGAATSGFTGFKVDSVYYYHGFPWGYLDSTYQAGEHSQEPYVMPTKIGTSTWNGTSGSMLSFSIPAALGAQEDVVRFEVFMSATDAQGNPVSVIGIYFYRKLQYQLAVQFCSDSLCTKPVTSVRVGDKVYMQSKVQNASGVDQPAQVINSVYGNPSLAASARNQMTNAYINSTTQLVPSFTGSLSLPVDFEQTGSQTVSLTGLVGASTSSAISILGVGTINVRPGTPYQVQFITPQTYQVKKCNGDPTDTANGCNEIQGSTPNASSLVVYDKFGNEVDTAASVSVNVGPNAFLGTIASPSAQAGSSITVGATAAAATTATTVVQTDATGHASFYIVANPGANPLYFVNGKNYPWVQLTGSVQGVAGAPIDTAVARILPPAGHLAWKSPSAVDTFILTPVRVTLMLTKDGTNPDVANVNATSKVVVSAANSTFIKFYLDSAMTTPVDTVTLAGSVATFFVASSKPTSQDYISGSITGFSTTDPPMPVKFRNPPQPPTPKLKSAVFLDGNCDGIADSVVVSFDPAGSPATLDATKVRVDRIKIAIGTDSIILDSTRLTVLGTGASVGISIPQASQTKLAAYTPTGTVSMWAALVRPPAADTIVAMGSVAVGDGIGPRPTAAALVENAAVGTVDDTLKVQFSEPVNYTGTTFPFLLFGSNGTSAIGTTGMSVVSATGSGTTQLTFVVHGNTGNLTENDILAIKSASGLTDLAGNDGRYTQCGNDTARVTLQPVAVPIDAAWIVDGNGDGKADTITVVFRRAFRKASEHPDSLIVPDWNNTASTTLPWTSADSVGTNVFKFAVNFPLGATMGQKADGSATLVLRQGALRNETYTLVDSVAPIAVGKAKLTLGSGSDKLVVTFSEPVKEIAGTVWLDRQRGSAPLSFTAATADAAKTTWTLTVASGTIVVGDSVRMDINGQSHFAAISNSQSPARSGLAPWVPVVGGDPAPDSAIILDLDGDGTADAVRLVYHNVVRGNPTFSFTWNGATVKADSASYGKTLAGKTEDTLRGLTGFPAVTTSGSGTGTSTSLVDGAAADPLPFPIYDGIAPVLDSVMIRYASDDGIPDTLQVTVSEAVAGADAASLLAFIPARFSIVPAAAIQTIDSRHYLILSAPESVLPGFGDSARLATGGKDALGNVVGDNSRRVPVLTGPHPIKYAASVYPATGVHRQDGDVPAVVSALPPVTAWIVPPAGSASVGSWVRMDPATGKPSTDASANLDTATAAAGLFGMQVEISTDFDGQILFYDNIGVFVGRTELNIKLKDLQDAGLVASNGKFTLRAAIHSSSEAAKQLASGVYMARLVSYSTQTVNGNPVRIMIQNKLFKFGYYSKVK
jgi:hypothetical protein